MKKRGVPLAILAVLFTNEIFDAFAQYCFKRTALAQGVPTMNSVSDALHFITSAASQSYLWLGVAAIAIVFLSWTIILSKVDLSVAIPLTSVSYVFVAVTSLVFLHEHISPARWAGILLILIGVALVSASSEHKESKQS